MCGFTYTLIVILRTAIPGRSNKVWKWMCFFSFQGRTEAGTQNCHSLYRKGTGQKLLCRRLYDHIAAAHGRFNRMRQVAPMCPAPSKTCIFGSTRLSIPNGISISSAVLHGSLQKVSINGPPLFPSNCPLARGISTPM